MAIRTYTTGLSLKHFPQNERGSVKKRLAAIVQQLSDENTKHCEKHALEVVNHLIDLDINNHCIMDPLPKINGGKGKYGVNELMKKIGNAKNHLHSGYHQLLTSCKGYIDRVNKFKDIFEFMEDNPVEFVSWTDFSVANKEIWKWTVMIALPDFIDIGIFNEAKQKLFAKKKLSNIDKARLEKYEDGLSAQILHMGPYAEEQPTIEKLHVFIKEQGYRMHKKHREIYFNSPERVIPEKLKTIIRQPITK